MDWEASFLAAAKRRGLRSSTLDNYRDKLHVLRIHNIDLKRCSGRSLVRVLDEFSDQKASYYHDLAIFVRMALKFLGRHDLVKLVEIPRIPRRVEQVREQVLDNKDVMKLIKKAPRLVDRLLVELFYETGARVGEIFNLRIKDVQFDEHSGVVWLRGKTDPRYRRVYAAVPDLKLYLNNHPNKGEGEAKFFDYSYNGIYIIIRRLGEKILGHRFHPHQFRHTRATEDSKYFTDREMMLRHGWTQPSTVGVYSHLSMKDVDDKDLVLHGRKLKEDVLKPLFETRKCVKCKSDNAPVSMFCHKCGAPLSLLTMSEENLLEHTMKQVREAK